MIVEKGLEHGFTFMCVSISVHGTFFLNYFYRFSYVAVLQTVFYFTASPLK